MMALSIEDKEFLDRTAQKLRDLLPAELAGTDGAIIEADNDPNSLLDILAGDYFAPWALPVVVARKRYWMSIGGVKCLMDYLKSPNVMTRMSSATACWSFAETLEFQRPQYELGALQEIIKLIQTNDVEGSLKKDINEVAFGWLWGFLEFDETLELANEQGVIPMLIESIGDDDMSMPVVIGCIQACAVHAGCRKSIVEAGGIAKLCGISTAEKVHDDMFKAIHLIVTAIAHLLNDDRYRQLCIDANATNMLNSFLNNATIEGISEIEDRQDFLWHSMSSFYTLCESDFDDVCEIECNVDVMIEEGIPAKLLCLSWNRNKSDRFTMLIKKASEALLKKTPVPTLKQICYYRLLDRLDAEELALMLSEHNIIM